MAKTIEARVIQKVATEAEWLSVTLPLYNGEIALVRSGDRVVNMKVGNGTSKFSELNYIYEGGFNGSINPSTDTSGLMNGFYFAEISGSYPNANNIVVREGYYTVLEKTSTGWKKSTEVKMPTTDLMPIINRLTTLETDLNVLDNTVSAISDDVEDLKNKSVIVDQYFDENSNNAQSGVGIFNEFKKNANYNKTIATDLFSQLQNGRIDSTNTIISDVGRKCIKNISIPINVKTVKIHVNMSVTIGSVPSDIYVPILGIKSDGSIVRLLEASVQDLNKDYEIDVTSYKYISVSGKNITLIELVSTTFDIDTREGIFYTAIKDISNNNIIEGLKEAGEPVVVKSTDFISELQNGRIDSTNTIQTEATRKYVRNKEINKTNNFQVLKVRMSVYIATISNVYAPVLGIKADGGIVQLLTASTSDVVKDYSIDITPYKYVSVSGKNIELLKIDEYNDYGDDGIITKKIKELSGSSGGNFSDIILKKTPISSINKTLNLKSINLINAQLSFPTIAKGRETSLGANDNPTIPLTNSGFTHMCVEYHAGGWNGFEYWCALTPYFGIINEQADVSQYENPHIFCSSDGVTWKEPIGIQNPIDTPSYDTTNGRYWSDTDIVIANDGYMYCFYRGNNQRLYKLNETTGTHAKAIGYKRSLDGVNWSPFKLLYSSDDCSLGAGSELVSPSFVKDGDVWNVFDVVKGFSSTPYSGRNQNLNTFIQRRVQHNLDRVSGKGFADITADKSVNFETVRLGSTTTSWHIDAKKYGNTYLILNNYATNGAGTQSKGLLFQYSTDGRNFKWIQDALFSEGCYRSTFLIKSFTSDEVTIWLYKNNRDTGIIDLYEVVLSIE